MQAALGVYRPTVSKFFLDGNFDHTAEFKLVFGAPGLDIGLLGDLSGSGTRYPVLFRGGIWYVDSSKDATVDQTIYFGAARRPSAVRRHRRRWHRRPGAVPRRHLVRECHAQRQRHRIRITLVARPGTSRWSATSRRPAPRPASSSTAAASGTGRPRATASSTGSTTSAARPATSRCCSTTTATASTISCIFRDGMWYVSTNRDGNANVAFFYGHGGRQAAVRGHGCGEHAVPRRRAVPDPCLVRARVDRAHEGGHDGLLGLHRRSVREAGDAAAGDGLAAREPAVELHEPAHGRRSGRRGELRHQLPARPLHAVRLAALLLPERADRSRPAAPARRRGRCRRSS